MKIKYWTYLLQYFVYSRTFEGEIRNFHRNVCRMNTYKNDKFHTIKSRHHSDRNKYDGHHYELKQKNKKKRTRNH